MPISGKETSSSVKLRWDTQGTSFQETYSYKIEFRAVALDPDAWTPVGVHEIETDVVIDDLSPGTTYEFRARTETKDGVFTAWTNQPYPNAQTLSLDAGNAVPEPVTKWGGVSVTSSTITLTWTAPENGGSPITSYTIMSRAGTTEYWSVTKSAALATYTATGIPTCKKVNFRVAAVNKHGIGRFTPVSSHLQSETSCDEDAPEKPGVVQVVTSELFALEVKWKPAARRRTQAVSQSYQLSYKPARSIQGEWISVVIKTIPYRIEPLLSGTAYMLRVQSVSGEALSEHTRTTLGRTAGAVPSKMAKPTELTKSPRSISIGWGPPDDSGDGSITEYTIRTTTDAEVTEITVGDPSATSFTVGNLEPGGAYDIVVSATNEFGSGPYSDPLSVFTNVGGGGFKIVTEIDELVPPNLTFTSPGIPGAVIYVEESSPSFGSAAPAEGPTTTKSAWSLAAKSEWCNCSWWIVFVFGGLFLAMVYGACRKRAHVEQFIPPVPVELQSVESQLEEVHKASTNNIVESR